MCELTSGQVKAARALLAWSQKELAVKARVATSTVADFERESRTPVANNIQAIRDALEREGLQFTSGGVVAKALFEMPRPTQQKGALIHWVDATSLSQWGERRDGQSGIPELLRRLIFATVGVPNNMRFPSGDSVYLPEWDGVCSVEVSAEPVPVGDSIWEISGQRDNIRGKADGDFNTRSDDPLGRDRKQTTFLFVTPHRFANKDAWITEKKSLGIWRDVRALDAVDLEHWLEKCPAVAQWLAVKLGKRPEGLRNLEDFWSEWQCATKTRLTEEIILVGRDEQQAAILKWLRQAPSSPFSVQAEAPDEALAFLYASISDLPEADRIALFSRCVMADTVMMARQLEGIGAQLIIAMIEPDPGLAQRLVDDGHHVFAVYGSSINEQAKGVLKLPKPWKSALKIALQQAGVEEQEAHQLAHSCGRSITILRRLMPVAPYSRPQWAVDALQELIAAMLVGAWDETSEPDKQVISELADRPYEEVEKVLAPLATSIDGPLVRTGNIWKVVSLRDLWFQVGAQLSTNQLTRFETAFHAVLGAINPRFTTRPKNIVFEAEGEFEAVPSKVLRRGLTETLIAMAVFPEHVRMIPDLQARVHGVIRSLFKRASCGLWWSLSCDFQNLAEAAPEVFLNAVEKGLEGTPPQIMALFRSDEGFMHRTEYLSNLLWALEMLAWSPDLLLQTALVLAHLHEVDPGGTYSNRPFGSLQRIFLSWFPQTYANSVERLQVIDKIIAEYPRVGWQLLLRLSPRASDLAHPSAKPNWRDFAAAEQADVTVFSVANEAAVIGERLLEQVGDNSERWQVLIQRWASFDLPWRERAIQKLTAFVLQLTDGSEREAIRDQLRKLLNHHRSYKASEWAMSEEGLKPLEEVLKLLQPTSAEDRVRWYFRPGAIALTEDWQSQEIELKHKQRDAAQELVTELTVEQLMTFATTITRVGELGSAIAQLEGIDSLQHELLQRGICADDSEEYKVEVEVGMGILWGQKSKNAADGDPWVYQLWQRAIAENWGELAELRIVQALPVTPHTWLKIAERTKSLSDAYWRKLNAFTISGDVDAKEVVDYLLNVGRVHEVIAWLGNNLSRASINASILINVLDAGVRSAPPPEGNDTTSFHFFVGLILDHLEKDATVSETEMVRLEFAYFPVLQHQRPSRTLHRALARDAGFFVELIKQIYLPNADSGVVEPEPTNLGQTRNVASKAFRILNDWSHVPGANDQGIIDTNKLEAWVESARILLKKVGRLEIGDLKIGEILSAAQRVPDQPWPPEPVQKLLENRKFRSDHLDEGFEIGVRNRRGVTTRMLMDGGEQERVLAISYRHDAKILRFTAPRTAACLNRIADAYEAEAKQQDANSEQIGWMG
jgi:transcriptional regulator with XRE-family HTH domain